MTELEQLIAEQELDDRGRLRPPSTDALAHVHATGDKYVDVANFVAPFARKLAPYRHGTENAYTNYGCRCDPCREAKSRWMKRYKRPCAKKCGRLAWRFGSKKGVCYPCAMQERTTRQHGTETCYVAGCRLPECRAAATEARRRRRERAAA